MSPSEETTQTEQGARDSGEGLREVLLRLTGPRYSVLQNEIDSLQDQIASLEESLTSVEGSLSRQVKLSDERSAEIHELLRHAQAETATLSSSLSSLDESLHDELQGKTERLQSALAAIEEKLVASDEVAQRVSPILISVTDKQVQENEEAYATAVAPVIGPAIRHQIRSSQQDIIDALFPIIGQIIGKALSEEIRELSRQVDTRLKQQLDLGSRLRLSLGRLRGIPEAELVLRDAIPYTIHLIFLIHQDTGLLLSHMTVSQKETEDPDLISGMLKAIQDFVRESFGMEGGELEEITYGDQRILLEGGRYAYAAVVLEGVEPPGYAGLIRDEVSKINVNHEAALRNFAGDMSELPDFQENLEALAAPTPERLRVETQGEPLEQGQKWLLIGGIIGIILLLGLVIFGCIFTIRLWPLAFP